MKNSNYEKRMRFASGLMIGLTSFLLTAPLSMVLAFMLLAGGLVVPFLPIGQGILGTGAAGAGEKTEEEKLMDKIKSEVKGILDGERGTTLDRLKHLETQLEGLKDFAALKDEHVQLMGAVKALKEKGAAQKESKSVRDQIKSFLEANPDKYNQFKNGEIKRIEIPIDLKAAGTMLVSTNTGSSSYLPTREIVPGVNDIARVTPSIEQYVNGSPTSSANIVWVNKKNQEGTAAMTAEGALKSQVDFELATETSTAKKVTAFTKVSTEMLDDIDFIAAEIENEIKYQIDIKVSSQLLTGDGTGQNLNGITDYAGQYVLTTVLTTAPKKGDAIIAAATQIKSLHFMPTHAFVSVIDHANMMIEKDTTGQPILNRLAELGLTVVASNEITTGNVLVADMSKYIKRDYKPLSISYGWVDDDFTKNLVTILGERRLHTYCSENNTGAFVYDTFANILTAITQA